jgi:hypothetical protein
MVHAEWTVYIVILFLTPSPRYYASLSYYAERSVQQASKQVELCQWEMGWKSSRTSQDNSESD